MIIPHPWAPCQLLEIHCKDFSYPWMENPLYIWNADAINEKIIKAVTKAKGSDLIYD